MSLYDEDVVLWAEQNALAVLEGRFSDVDRINVAEELRDVGRGEARAVRSNLVQVLVHMLKSKYQSGMQTRSWETSLVEHRRRLGIELRNSPSLRARLPELVSEAYSIATARAARQTRMALSVFPVECEFSVEEVVAPEDL